jgi:hypothetical protein
MYKIIIKEMKKINGLSCSDIEGECDKSLGLYCQGKTNSKTCSYANRIFFNTNLHIEGF